MARKEPIQRSKDAPNTGRIAYPGVVSTLEIYTIEEAKRRLRWSDSAFRAAKRRGLSLLTAGKRRYVSGQEILRFLTERQTSSVLSP